MAAPSRVRSIRSSGKLSKKQEVGSGDIRVIVAAEQVETLVHELAHLYCGHLGTPNENWWRNRTGLPEAVCEFEAESVCYLVCGRAGIDNPSDKYLAEYLKQNQLVPDISLECVMAAAGLIEKMGSERLKPRKGTSPKRDSR